MKQLFEEYGISVVLAVAGMSLCGLFFWVLYQIPV